jgi:hypothetical protein
VSTTVSKHQHLIGGEWVDASSGETSLEDYTQIKHVMAKID